MLYMQISILAIGHVFSLAKVLCELLELAFGHVLAQDRFEIDESEPVSTYEIIEDGVGVLFPPSTSFENVDRVAGLVI